MEPGGLGQNLPVMQNPNVGNPEEIERWYGPAPEGPNNQKAVAFLAGPRERIHVFGNPVEHCPRCQLEGHGNVSWRPHRHIGELKIRYICERKFDDLESTHHFDIPLCPLCGQVHYLYEFNAMLGISSARRLHKYVLKCANRHVLPLLDLFCQAKKGGERCNANFKLQWCYGTMVKRCESQKNRDHDLWWVRYKNEWKQRRTVIRYKKEFLSHLSDVQRARLLGLGVEGEPPPDPKTALGPTYDALVATNGGSPSGPKIKKRAAERAGLPQFNNMGSQDEYDLEMASKRHHRDPYSPHPGHLMQGLGIGGVPTSPEHKGAYVGHAGRVAHHPAGHLGHSIYMDAHGQHVSAQMSGGVMPMDRRGVHMVHPMGMHSSGHHPHMVKDDMNSQHAAGYGPSANGGHHHLPARGEESPHCQMGGGAVPLMGQTPASQSPERQCSPNHENNSSIGFANNMDGIAGGAANALVDTSSSQAEVMAFSARNCEAEPQQTGILVKQEICAAAEEEDPSTNEPEEPVL